MTLLYEDHDSADHNNMDKAKLYTHIDGRYTGSKMLNLCCSTTYSGKLSGVAYGSDHQQLVVTRQRATKDYSLQ